MTPHSTDAPAERARVRERIGAVLVRLWCQEIGREFHALDLWAAVEAEVGTVAPDSPRRVMCELRRERLLHYRLLSRADSLYRWEPVPPAPVYREPVQTSLLEAARA